LSSVGLRESKTTASAEKNFVPTHESQLDIRRVLDILPHRYPFVMIDRVLEFVSDDELIALKNVTINEPFFQGHYPGRPVMPGVLQIEAMAQAAGVLLLRRLPIEENWALKRSYCPVCKTTIPFYRNIPLLSFFLQRGRCHSCNAKISIQYPLVEAICGVVSILLMPTGYDLNQVFNYFFLMSVFCSFLVHIVVDVRHKILPDEINLYLALLFLTYGLLRQPYLEVLLGGLVGFFLPYSVAYLFFKIRGIEGLGGGDIKLFGALGIYLGIKGIMLNIFMSCFLGSVIGIILIFLKLQDKNKPLAFGPFIIVSAFFQIFFPDFVFFLSKTVGLII